MHPNQWSVPSMHRSSHLADGAACANCDPGCSSTAPLDRVVLVAIDHLDLDREDEAALAPRNVMPNSLALRTVGTGTTRTNRRSWTSVGHCAQPSTRSVLPDTSFQEGKPACG